MTARLLIRGAWLPLGVLAQLYWAQLSINFSSQAGHNGW